jgi:hypothetical protein
MAPQRLGMLATLRALLPVRLIWRQSLKHAQQH